MDNSKTAYFAHRGANFDLPENTVFSIKHMIEKGIDGIEVDVRLTQDGQVILSHDPDFKRTAGIAKKICDMSLEEIKKINVAHYLKKFTSPIFVAKLEEVLDICKMHNLRCSIELKPEEDFSLIDKVYDIIKATKTQPLVQIYSFNLEMVKEFSRKNPPFPLHLNLEVDPMPYLKIAMENRWGLNPRFDLVSKVFVEACKENNISVHTWTVNNREMKKLLTCWGVKAIISDDLHTEPQGVGKAIYAHKR